MLDEAAGMFALEEDVREVAVRLMPEGDGHACAIAGSLHTILGKQCAGEGAGEERVLQTDAAVGTRADDEHVLAQGENTFGEGAQVDESTDEQLIAVGSALDGLCSIGSHENDGLAVDLIDRIFGRRVTEISERTAFSSLLSTHKVSQGLIGKCFLLGGNRNDIGSTVGKGCADGCGGTEHVGHHHDAVAVLIELD